MLVREATAADASAISALIAELGYPVEPAQIEERLALMARRGEPALVAQTDAVVGCLTWHTAPNLHRPGPVGRITALIVADGQRGAGIGRALNTAAEQRMRALGCAMVEVSSNMRREGAHAFYERLGYDRTSFKFAKPL